MENKVPLASVRAMCPFSPDFNVDARLRSAKFSGFFCSVVLLKRGASSPTLKLGARGFGKRGGGPGLLGSGNIFSIYRRALVRAHILERLQVARSGEFRAADNSFPWSIYGRSMVYLWSIPWSIYDLSQVFVGFRHFACVEQKNKQFLSSRPKAKKLVKREIDHR